MVGRLRTLVPRFVRQRYALKFMLALFVLAASVGAVGLFGTKVIAAEAEQQVESDALRIAEDQGEKVEQATRNEELETARLAEKLRTVPPERRSAVLEREHQSIDGNHNIYVLDVANGTILNSTNAELAGKPIKSADTLWGQQFGYMGEGVYENKTVYDAWKLDWMVRWIAAIGGTAPDGTNVMNYHRLLAADGSDRGKLLIVAQKMSERGEVLSNEDGRVSYVIDEKATLTQEEAPYGTIVLTPNESVLYEPYRNGDNFDPSKVPSEPEIHDIGKPGEALAATVGPEYADKEYIAVAKRLEFGDGRFIIVYHAPREQAFGFSQSVNRYGTAVTFGGVFLIVLIGGVIGRNTSRSIQRLRSKAEQMEEGNLSVEFDSPRVDSIGRLYDGFDTMRNSLREQIRAAEEAREEAETERERIERMNEHLQAKADEHRDVMRRCAGGDLTARMDPESDNDAMREIAEEFNVMVETLVNEVAAISEETTAESENVAAAAEEQTSSLTEVTRSASNLSRQASELSEALDQFETNADDDDDGRESEPTGAEPDEPARSVSFKGSVESSGGE